MVTSKTRPSRRSSRRLNTKVNYNEADLAMKAIRAAREEREKQEMAAFNRSNVGRLAKGMSQLMVMDPTKKNTIQQDATKRAALLHAARTERHALYGKQARHAFGTPPGVKASSPTSEDDDMANLLDEISKLAMIHKRSRKHKKKSRKHKKRSRKHKKRSRKH
mgnify:CR=1 FL=1